MSKKNLDTDDSGKVAGTVGANTEDRQQDALLTAAALQNVIFNSANFASIATDAKGVIQIFNVGAERMLGYTAAEVINKITLADLSDPQEVIARAKALSGELGTPTMHGFEALVFKASRGIEDIYELSYIRNDGKRFPAVVSVTALRDEHAAIIGYLLIGTDNTARKQVEEEWVKLDQGLRDQQFYSRSLIESNIDAIVTTDPQGIISDVNKQMEALTGCTRDELIGAPFKNYFTDPERAEASIKQALAGGKITNYELTSRARDGKETVVSYNTSILYDRGRRLQGVFAAAHDITESKRLDQALQDKDVELQSAKVVAEKANHSKSDFLSSMSQELRSPLNAILGFAQLMESDTPSPTTGQKESIDQILQAGWHLLKLINETLDLAKIESGKPSLSPEAVSLAEVTDECQEMIEGHAQKRDGELEALAQSHTQSGAREHIVLYVEDNPANLKLVEQIIARHPGLRLLSAVTGNHGIELARANLPEVILMDINLPDISGIEAMKVLRKDPATAHIPVVAVSVNSMPHDVKKSLLAGFFRYIIKPINLDEFMGTLNIALEFVEKGGRQGVMPARHQDQFVRHP